VSVDGAYLEAPDKWYPGTVITLILQLGSARPASPDEESPTDGELSPCAIRAVVVRSAPDGFGVEFLFGNDDERIGFGQFLREAVGMDGSDGTSLPGSNQASSS